MSARTKPLAIVEAVDIPKVAEVKSYDTPSPRGQVKMIAADDAAKLVDALHTEAKVI
ncbi:hypothetical protein D3C78_1565000 [compost metagenome]